MDIDKGIFANIKSILKWIASLKSSKDKFCAAKLFIVLLNVPR